jgi:predicted HTH domain antitoxin
MTPQGLNTAIELYRSGTLPLTRAAKIAGCTEGQFREVVEEYAAQRRPIRDRSFE